MSRIRKRDPVGARYDALKAQWQAHRTNPEYAGDSDWLIDKPELPVDAAPFLQTLQALSRITQDRRFWELHRSIMQSGLVDIATGHWSRYGATLMHPLTQEVCNKIELHMAEEMSERLAIAEAVAAYAVRATSFEAACKSIKRVLEAWRKSVGQKQP
jgi:hypothetical protein